MASPHHHPGLGEPCPCAHPVVKLSLGGPRAFFLEQVGKRAALLVSSVRKYVMVTHCCAPAQPGGSHCVTQSCHGAREALGLLGGTGSRGQCPESHLTVLWLTGPCCAGASAGRGLMRPKCVVPRPALGGHRFGHRGAQVASDISPFLCQWP